MPQRLIFTSSPKALIGSRTGFCTVARSRSISEKLASLIEKIGTYEHVDNIEPIVYSHRILNFAGFNYHILSRMIDSGVDYTNRTNFLADHFIFSSNEITNLGNPADVLLGINCWHDKWEGEPKWIEDVECNFAKYEKHIPSLYWNEVFGDSGKASLLINKSYPIIAKAGNEKTLLKLFSESLSLFVNPIDAWSVTFTTRFSKSDNPTDFHWKTYIEGDGLYPQGDSINLSLKKTPILIESKESIYARTGELKNKDRLNLKAANPDSLNTKVVTTYVDYLENSPSRERRNIFLFAFAIAISILIILIFFIFQIEQSQNDFDVPDDIPLQLPLFEQSKKQNINIDEEKPLKPNFREVSSNIEKLVMGCKFEEALRIWNNSGFKNVYPNYEIGILKNISSKCSIITNELRAILNTIPDETRKAEMLLKLSIIESALEIKNLPNRENILKNFKQLESEIKK